ncbi:hypothetical protein [Geothrix sp. PMB-07]|uniref:hypothetical protein n=1 Tax=Geothrix sp. PMB-07 TaxID=3068640 RepID=UPI00274120E8|nr:hypothetical protein [Geothrix sp. PMB-07]WLT32349.1 hypothetical protein Q9293_03245 [Geothrix sp. PMB-07]
MNASPAWLDHLKLLAATEVVRPGALSPANLDDLVARGLIQRDERPKQASLESRYEALQDTHRKIVEAKGCVDRLQRQLAPKSRLASLLPGFGGHAGPRADDPDLRHLLQYLELLKLQVRGVAAPQDVMPHLERILEHLQVEGRECLDRLAATDRELDQTKKEALPGTQVEGQGFFRLTPAGEAALPEAPIIELLEMSLHTAFGSSLRGESYGHFREDPSALMSLLVDRAALGDRPSAVVGEYDELLEAFERLPAFADLHPLRAKIGFLVRLMRTYRGEPKKAFLWCNRERLAAANQRMKPLLPPSVAASGWHLPYMADVFLADGGISGDEAQAEQRIHLFEAVHRVQAELLQDTRIRDGQFFRLALVLAHAARGRNFAPGILLDRFVRQAVEAVVEAARAAPYDLGDRGTMLIFGAHLAHAAGFSKAKLQGPLEAFAAIQERFRSGDATPRISVQVLLHIFATLDRLQRLGAPVSVEAYAGLFDRIRKRLIHHKGSSRAFSTAQIKAGDEAALASNLCAQTCFRDLVLPQASPFHPDAGLAGLYEARLPGRPPVMGSCFGTLLLI